MTKPFFHIANEDFSKTIDYSNQAFLLLDKNLSILEINHEMAEIFMCEQSLFRGKNIHLFFELHGHKFPFTPEQLSHGESNTYFFKTTFQSPSKTYPQIAWTLTTLPNQKNSHIRYGLSTEKPSKVNSSNVDLFSLSIADDLQLHASTKTEKGNFLLFLQNILDAMPGPAHFKSADNLSYQLCNKNNLTLYSLTNKEQILGKNMEEIAKIMDWRWSNHYTTEIEHIDRNVLLEQTPLIGINEKPYLSVQGKVVMHSLTKIPLIDSNSKSLGILTIAIDKTNNMKCEDLRKLYYQYYTDPKKAHEKFIETIGLNHCLKKGKNITERELDYLIYYVHGKSAKEIARLFDISPRTFESTIEQLQLKFDAPSKTAMIQQFLKIYY